MLGVIAVAALGLVVGLFGLMMKRRFDSGQGLPEKGSDIKRLVIEFPDNLTRESFASWFCDGGGEQEFFEADKIYSGRENRRSIGRFSYERCWPAWGYNLKKHGPDLIITAHFMADEH